MKIFLQEGADINSTSDTGVTALMYASQGCFPKVVAFLLRHGAEVNLRDSRGRTALMYASRACCLKAVRLLLSHPKTRVRLKDKAGRTAENYAKTRTTLEVDGPAFEIINLLRRRH